MSALMDVWRSVTPSRWEWAKLNLVSSLGTGHTPDRNRDEYWIDCDIPWVTAADLSGREDAFAPLMHTVQHVSGLGIRRSAAVVHPPGTVMFCRTASVGLFCITGTQMATTQAFVTWTPGPRLDGRFLLYVIAAMSPEFERLAYGSTHLTIYMPDLEALRVPVPPLDEQRRIADFLDDQVGRIDGAVVLRRHQASLSTLRLQSWLENHLALPATAQRPLRTLVNLITSGPRGWGEFVGETGSPFMRVTNTNRLGIEIDRSDLALVDSPPGPERERSRTREGDLLMSITAELGSVAVVPEDLADGNVSQHVALIRSVPALCDSRWLAWTVQVPYVRAKLTTAAYGGTKVGLGLGAVASLRVPHLPIAQQRQLAAQADEQGASWRAITNWSTQQVALFQERKGALITAAVTGEFDVSTASGRNIA